MAVRQSTIPNARYHRMTEARWGAGNFSNRFDPQIATARRGAATTKIPSAMQVALTDRFITSAALIHMLAHIEIFCGRWKHVALASNPDI
jgi:hypothetical protein